MSDSDFDKYLLLPCQSSLKSRNDVNLATRVTKGLYMGIPIMTSPMNTVTEARMALAIAKWGGVGIVHRYMTPKEQAIQIETFRGGSSERFLVGAAIGVSDVEERVKALMSIEDPPDFLMFDIAHGDMLTAYDALKFIKRDWDVPVISGNIVTADAAIRYDEYEADGFRVGMGSGSMCTTRRVAGVGRNQLTAIRKIHEAVPETPITSCGGIRTSGDVVKALAAGASSVLIGSLFASCDESPAPREGGKIRYAGMASFFGESLRVARTGEDPNDIHHFVAPEGMSALLEPTGPLHATVERLLGGVRAGFAYLGAENIEELWRNARWEEQ